MSSRERRMLHLAFRAYPDLETASSGEGMRRFVVAYPKGYDHRDDGPRQSHFRDRRR
jgi:spoIIIJ-associated protein